MNCFAQCVVALTLLVASARVAACECLTGPLDARYARAQKNVFQFRVLSMKVVGDELHFQSSGSIEVLSSLKGDGNHFRTVRVGFHGCCGIRLQPGLRYIAFTSQRGPVLVAHLGNILEIRQTGFADESLHVSESVRRLLVNGEDLHPSIWEYSEFSLPIFRRPYCPDPGRRATYAKPTPAPGSHTPAPATSIPRPRN